MSAIYLEFAIQMPRVPTQKVHTSARACGVTLGTGKPVSISKASIARNLLNPKYYKHRENINK